MAGEAARLEYLANAIDQVQLACDSAGCEAWAVYALTCRQITGACSLVCADHRELIETVVSAIGHFHCSACGEGGAILPDIATVTEL